MAKRIEFKRDYDLYLAPNQFVAYKRGYAAIVPDEQADAMVGAGAAEIIEDVTPKKTAAKAEADAKNARSKS